MIEILGKKVLPIFIFAKCGKSSSSLLDSTISYDFHFNSETERDLSHL